MFNNANTKIIEFTQSVSPYGVGDVAGFPEYKAENLVKSGAAIYRKDLQKDYDRNYAAQQKELRDAEESGEMVRKPRRTVRTDT